MKTKATATIAIIAAAAFLSSCEKTQPVVSDNPPAAEKADAYPLDICVVSGEKLGSMGEPHVITHEGTTVKLCCKSCLKDFNEDPDKYIAMIREAEAE